MGVREGMPITTDGSLDQCLKTKQKVNDVLKKELYGVAIKAIAIPIIEDNKLVGAMATGTSLETQQALHEAAQTAHFHDGRPFDSEQQGLFCFLWIYL